MPLRSNQTLMRSAGLGHISLRYRGFSGRDDILAVLGGAGIDAAQIAAAMDSTEVSARLAANTAEAAERGVFGAPTIFVGEAMFFGNDRFDFVRDTLGRQAKAA